MSKSVGSLVDWVRLRASDLVGNLDLPLVSRPNTAYQDGDRVVSLDRVRRQLQAASPAASLGTARPWIARGLSEFTGRLATSCGGFFTNQAYLVDATKTGAVAEEFSAEMAGGRSVRTMRVRPVAFAPHLTVQRITALQRCLNELDDVEIALPDRLKRLSVVAADLVDVAQWGQKDTAFNQLLWQQFVPLTNQVLVLLNKMTWRHTDQLANTRLLADVHIFAKNLDRLRQYCDDVDFTIWARPYVTTLAAVQCRMHFRLVVD